MGESGDRRGATTALVVATLIAIGSPAFARVEGNLRADIGYRTGELRWSIGLGDDGPDVLSELTFSDLQIVQLRLEGEISIARRWVGTGLFSVGAIVDGDARDSDYAGDGRALEWSRSENSVDGDEIIDASGAVGFRFFAGKLRRHKITPLVGLHYAEQHVRMTDGNQTLFDEDIAAMFGIGPIPLGPFGGLDSTYETEWFGPWIGLDAQLPVSDRQRVTLRGEYHWTDYEAVADWNLRDDFAHPTSFAHEASGTGVVMAFAWAFRRSSVRLDYERWSTDPGIDVIYFADGTQATTGLNAVDWDSIAISYGFSLIRRERQWSPKPPDSPATDE